MNPLTNTISEAEQIVAQLIAASEELEGCIADERTWFARLKESQETFEMAESEIVSEAVIAGKLGEGPFANVAATGKTFEIILNKVKNDARNGPLSAQWKQYSTIRRNHELAQIDLARAETHFAGLKRVADLKAAILRAAVI
jgi:hypothetical protein